MTEQEREAKIRGLLEERRGYENRGEQSRVDLVNKALRDMGHEGAAPAKRAATRVIKPAATRVVEAETTEVAEPEEIRAPVVEPEIRAPVKEGDK